MFLDNEHFINLFYTNELFNSKNDYSRPAIFADRDGVIIKDKHYISNDTQVELEEGALKFLKSAFKLKIPVIIVTNQSGISRGFFSWNDYVKVTKRMMQIIGAENPIIAIFANGLSPNSAPNSWRKPNPAMIQVASHLLNINKNKSLLIGDRESDIKAAINGNILNIIHVATGHGNREKETVRRFIDNSHSSENKENTFKIIFKNNIGEINLKEFTCLY